MAVVTADFVSPFPATGGKLGIYQGSSTVQRGTRHTWTSSHRHVEHSGPVLGSAALPAKLRDPSFSMKRNQGHKER